jgi:spore germination protein GerM
MRGRLLYVLIVAAVVLFILGFAFYRGVLAPSQLRTGRAEARLYFANLEATKVVAEIRSLPYPRLTPMDLVDELIKGPANKDLLATIPVGTRLLGIALEGGVAHVNFSSEIRESHAGGTAAELMTIYSVVATLTELEGIGAVQFQIQGEVVDSIWGHMDTSSPIEPDSQFISR